MATTIETSIARIACDDLTDTYLLDDLAEMAPAARIACVCYSWSRDDMEISGQAVLSPADGRFGINLNGQPDWADAPDMAGGLDAIAAHMVDMYCNDFEQFEARN